MQNQENEMIENFEKTLKILMERNEILEKTVEERDKKILDLTTINIEVVEAYLIEEEQKIKQKDGTVVTFMKKIGWSMHIKVVNTIFEFKGIRVLDKKNGWFFVMPTNVGIHHQSHVQVRFPLVNISEITKKKEFMDELVKKGVAYINKKLIEMENTPICTVQIKKKQPKK